MPFRFINFEDETGRGQVPTRVVYFFVCNGSYEESPQAVRAKLQDLRERHGYYAKVELMITDYKYIGRTVSEDADDPAAKASLVAMKDLIASALPDIERCLPDWSAVKAGRERRRGGRRYAAPANEAVRSATPLGCGNLKIETHQDRVRRTYRGSYGQAGKHTVPRRDGRRRRRDGRRLLRRPVRSA